MSTTFWLFFGHIQGWASPLLFVFSALFVVDLHCKIITDKAEKAKEDVMLWPYYIINRSLSYYEDLETPSLMKMEIKAKNLSRKSSDLKLQIRIWSSGQCPPPSEKMNHSIS